MKLLPIEKWVPCKRCPITGCNSDIQSKYFNCPVPEGIPNQTRRAVWLAECWEEMKRWLNQPDVKRELDLDPWPTRTILDKMSALEKEGE